MQYKTIVLELIQQNREVHKQLRKTRMLRQALDYYATELKMNHELWMEFLSHRRPGKSHYQIASESLEIALKDLETTLASSLPPEEGETLLIETILEFVRGRPPLV